MKLIHKYLILGVAAAGAFTACDNYDADDHKFDNVVYLDVSKTDEVQPATFSNNTPTVEKPIQATLAYPTVRTGKCSTRSITSCRPTT